MYFINWHTLLVEKNSALHEFQYFVSPAMGVLMVLLANGFCQKAGVSFIIAYTYGLHTWWLQRKQLDAEPAREFYKAKARNGVFYRRRHHFKEDSMNAAKS